MYVRMYLGIVTEVCTSRCSTAVIVSSYRSLDFDDPF